MTTRDAIALLPIIILSATALTVLIIGAWWRNHLGKSIIALAGFAAAFATVFVAASVIPHLATTLLRVDGLALFYTGLFCVGGVAVALLAHDHLQPRRRNSEKFHAMLLLAVAGMCVLSCAVHFASVVVGLELLSVSLYGLTGYTLRRPRALEASLKYLVLASVSLAFLLFGMALVYFETGTMMFAELARAGLGESGRMAPLMLLGVGMMLVGFAFKLAIVPFHAWAPDVYQGAPAPVSALISTGSKAAVFALLIRLVVVLTTADAAALSALIATLSVVTMTAGNLLALLQRNLKRLLAYSSVAHVGYLLIPLLADGQGADGVSPIGFYFAAYTAATVCAFGVVSVLSARSEEVGDLAEYRGLGLRRRWLGAVLGLAVLSLAGIPPTAGFMAKFVILAAAARAGLWLLLVLGVANSGLAVYYYVRVLIALYTEPPPGERDWPATRPASAIAVAGLSAVTVLLGAFPGPLFALAEAATRGWLSP